MILLSTILTILHVLFALGVITTVLLQSGRSAGLSGLSPEARSSCSVSEREWTSFVENQYGFCHCFHAYSNYSDSS